MTPDDPDLAKDPEDLKPTTTDQKFNPLDIDQKIALENQKQGFISRIRSRIRTGVQRFRASFRKALVKLKSYSFLESGLSDIGNGKVSSFKAHSWRSQFQRFFDTITQPKTWKFSFRIRRWSAVLLFATVLSLAIQLGWLYELLVMEWISILVLKTYYWVCNHWFTCGLLTAVVCYVLIDYLDSMAEESTILDNVHTSFTEWALEAHPQITRTLRRLFFVAKVLVLLIFVLFVASLVLVYYEIRKTDELNKRLQQTMFDTNSSGNSPDRFLKNAETYALTRYAMELVKDPSLNPTIPEELRKIYIKDYYISVVGLKNVHKSDKFSADYYQTCFEVYRDTGFSLLQKAFDYCSRVYFVYYQKAKCRRIAEKSLRVYLRVTYLLVKLGLKEPPQLSYAKYKITSDLNLNRYYKLNILIDRYLNIEELRYTPAIPRRVRMNVTEPKTETFYTQRKPINPGFFL